MSSFAARGSKALKKAAGRGMVIVLSGPSGVGKTTILNELRARDPKLVESVSATTRRMRKGEVEGRDYFFMSEEDFERKAAAGGFAEQARVFGNRYGTPAEFLESAVSSGRDVIMDIDVQGAAQLMKTRRGDGLFIFISPKSTDVLLERIKKRGAETEEETMRRLAVAREELACAPRYDYNVVNDDLGKALGEVMAILDKERHKRRGESQV